MQATHPDSNLARRAVGAMFLFPFGGAWLGYAAFQALGANFLALAVVGLVTAALFGLAFHRYLMHRSALRAEAGSQAQKRTAWQFRIINAIQWTAILVAVNVLNRAGLARWFAPCIMLIVGVHFLPLARILQNPSHYVTGAALITVAIFYPWLAPNGPASAVGCLLAAVILWVSALRAVFADNSSSLVVRT